MIVVYLPEHIKWWSCSLAFLWKYSKSETYQPEGRTSKGKGSCPKTGSNARRFKQKDLRVNPDRLLRCEGVKKGDEVSGDLNEVKVL